MGFMERPQERPLFLAAFRVVSVVLTLAGALVFVTVFIAILIRTDAAPGAAILLSLPTATGVYMAWFVVWEPQNSGPGLLLLTPILLVAALLTIFSVGLLLFLGTILIVCGVLLSLPVAHGLAQERSDGLRNVDTFRTKV